MRIFLFWFYLLAFSDDDGPDDDPHLPEIGSFQRVTG